MNLSNLTYQNATLISTGIIWIVLKLIEGYKNRKPDKNHSL